MYMRKEVMRRALQSEGCRYGVGEHDEGRCCRLMEAGARATILEPPSWLAGCGEAAMQDHPRSRPGTWSTASLQHGYEQTGLGGAD